MEQITITAKVQIVATDTDKVLLNKTMSVTYHHSPGLPQSEARPVRFRSLIVL